MMTREDLIKRTIDNLSKMSDQGVLEVANFAEFLLSRLDDTLISDGIQQLAQHSQAFQFLMEDEVQYSRSDLKEVYIEKR